MRRIPKLYSIQCNSAKLCGSELVKQHYGRSLVVYFTADFGEQTPKNVPGFENYDYVITTYEDAYKKITFDAVRDMLVLANDFLTKRLN